MTHMNEMVGFYNPSLVILSLIIAITFSYTSFDLTNRVTISRGWTRKAWLFSGAVAMGIGIWSMHFIAMIALHLPQDVTYDLVFIFISILFAIVASLVGLYLSTTPNNERNKLVLGGIFMGVGVSGMHYIGMEAMRGIVIHYNPFLLSLSVFIAICTMIITLLLASYLKEQSTSQITFQRFLCSLVMGISIFSMHFTGMKAATFTAEDHPFHSKLHLLVLSETVIAIAIAAFTLMLLFCVLISSYVDQQFKIQSAEKIQILYDLTGAFAHEIRNPMQVNRGFLQLMNEKMLDKDLKNYINICIEEMDRANEIINDYLAFAKPQVAQIELVDVKEQILRVINIISSYALMNKVEIELRSILEKPTQIYVNPQKFNQSLINILKNGIEAMPLGGKLIVCCRSQNHDVVIDISDEGIGMTKEQIKRLGTPFYSLKEKGTGLGLMVSYRIIHSFSGKISVKSETGKGTTFSICFPQFMA